MPKAKKLPSGSWRCRVYSHTEKIAFPDGTIKEKKVYESFTCDDPSSAGRRECERMAAEFAAGKEQLSHSGRMMTFGQALDMYIEERSAILSPASIRKYNNMKKNAFPDILNVALKDLNQDMVQKYVNGYSANHSSKSVRDAHGLIVAVLNRYYPQVAFRTTLPKKERPDTYVPSDNDIKKLIDEVMDTDMELPVYLAAFGAMRRGEIAALQASDLSGNTVHVSKSMVESPSGEWIVKAPKSYAGDRFVTLPDFVVQKFPKSGSVTHLNPTMISQHFSRVRKHINLDQMRFHDLRHYCASIMHAIGIPDAYIMQMGGWGNDGVLKSVYRHVLEEEQKKENAKAVKHFSEMYDTKYDTNKKTARK